MRRPLLLMLTLALLVLRAAVAQDAPAPPQLGDTRSNPSDGAVMVYVPAGDFLMGNPEGVGGTDEQPQHTVTLDAYWVYRDDVTVDQYRKFCTDTKRAMPKEPDYGWQGDNPITNVTWSDAKAYADWSGVALPTEAQREKAARGTDGRNYPWGGLAIAADQRNGWDATKCACRANSHGPQAVGSFPAGNSPYGARDMAGNVWNWCADSYGANYYTTAPATNPTGPATGNRYVLRGGSWREEFGCEGDINNARCTFRNFSLPGDRCGETIGFRCVAPATP
jgi:formylglycine-generating enzyme required for sulfatase activity